MRAYSESQFFFMYSLLCLPYLCQSRLCSLFRVAMGWQDAYHEVERAVSLTEVAESCSRFVRTCVNVIFAFIVLFVFSLT